MARRDTTVYLAHTQVGECYLAPCEAGENRGKMRLNGNGNFHPMKSSFKQHLLSWCPNNCFILIVF